MYQKRPKRWHHRRALQNRLHELASADTHTYTHIPSHTHIHTHIHTYTHIYTHIHTHTHTHTQIHTHTHTHTHIHTRTHTYTHIHTHTYTYTRGGEQASLRHTGSEANTLSIYRTHCIYTEHILYIEHILHLQEQATKQNLIKLNKLAQFCAGLAEHTGSEENTFCTCRTHSIYTGEGDQGTPKQTGSVLRWTRCFPAETLGRTN
jgi:hypothetical protein